MGNDKGLHDTSKGERTETGTTKGKDHVRKKERDEPIETV